MAILNQSTTPVSEKDYWRTSPELINDALYLLGVKNFDIDVCATNGEVAIRKIRDYITEEENAFEKCWFSLNQSRAGKISFCNPPFSKKWEFFQRGIEQVKAFGNNVFFVLPYTPCTKEWHENVGNADCIIYAPNGRYQYLLPDGSKSSGSCNFETCLVLIVPFKCGNVIVNYERGIGSRKE